tara:strand:- start:333 stop:653 length:321 start_codon:yes stop_codon:yes gene_type:complete
MSNETHTSSTLTVNIKPRSPRREFLEEAAHITDKRGEKYGPPAEHFGRTVGMINAAFGHILKRELTPKDWALIMVLDKVAREQNVPVKDNLQDIAGYAACAHECTA